MPTNKTGLTPLSFTQQFLLADPGKFVVNGKLYMYEAGLTLPVNGYSDANGLFPLPNPVTLAADGRIPPIYFIMADDSAVPGTFVTIRTSVRMRLLDKNGVIQFDYQVVPLLTSDPAGGGGGPPPTPIDTLGLMTTGMMMAKYGIGKIPGFARANGLTIGAAGSGATEEQGAALEALYLHLWGADATLRDPTTLGNPASDFGAGKLVKLPNFSGRAMAGLDNMADVPAGILSTQVFSVVGRGPTVLGAEAGTEQHVLGSSQIPLHDHPAYFVNETTHTHNLKFGSGQLGAGGNFGVNQIAPAGTSTATTEGATVTGRIRSSPAGTVDDKTGQGPTGTAGLAHLNLQPSKLVTFYLRL